MGTYCAYNGSHNDVYKKALTGGGGGRETRDEAEQVAKAEP